MPGVLIVTIDVAQMPRPCARAAIVTVGHHPTTGVLAIVIRVIGQVVVTAAVAVDPMTVMVAAVVPIFARVTILSAIVSAAVFILTAVLIAADALVALFAHYIAIVRRPSLDASSLMLLTALVTRRTLRLSLMLRLSRMLFAARIVTRRLLMMRIAMRFIRMRRLSLRLMGIVIAAIIFSSGTDRSRDQSESEQAGY
jgi:hypothetical protein